MSGKLKGALLLFVGVVLGYGLTTLLDSTATVISDHDSEYDYFAVHGVDSNTYEHYVDFYLKVPEAGTVEERFRYFLNEFSRARYKGRKMELASIDTLDGKMIATINLADPPDVSYGPWYGSFQGGTGGYVTTLTLIETILQRDYKGDWIDACTFTYNSKSLREMDHVPDLSYITWRDSTLSPTTEWPNRW